MLPAATVFALIINWNNVGVLVFFLHPGVVLMAKHIASAEVTENLLFLLTLISVTSFENWFSALHCCPNQHWILFSTIDLLTSFHSSDYIGVNGYCTSCFVILLEHKIKWWMVCHCFMFACQNIDFIGWLKGFCQQMTILRILIEIHLILLLLYNSMLL